MYYFVLGFDDCCLVQLESLPAMVAGVWSSETNLQLEATTQFRKLLSIGKAMFLYWLCFFGFTFCYICVCVIGLINVQKEVHQLKKLYSRVLFLAL